MFDFRPVHCVVVFCLHLYCMIILFVDNLFSADRTNGRAIGRYSVASVCRLSVCL